MDVERKGFIRRFLSTEISEEENKKFLSFARTKRGARIGAAAGFGVSSGLCAGALAFASVKAGSEITLNDLKLAGEFTGLIVAPTTGVLSATGATIDVFRPISRRAEAYWRENKENVIWVANLAKRAANKIRHLGEMK